MCIIQPRETESMTETKNNFKIYDFNEKKQDSTLYNNVKNYYILHHYFWGCKNTEEEYVYSESEINSKKIQNYASNHTYKKYPIEAYRLESKKHNIDDVLELEPSNGWSPIHLLKKNGFNLIGEIDLIEIFDGNYKKECTTKSGQKFFTRQFTYERPPHNLKDKKEIIQNELKKYNYENKNLIILRSSRSSAYAYWDYIEILLEPKLPAVFYRVKLNLKKTIKNCNSFLKYLYSLRLINQMD